MRSLSIIGLLTILCSLPLAAQTDFIHPDYMSFESGKGISNTTRPGHTASNGVGSVPEQC